MSLVLIALKKGRKQGKLEITDLNLIKGPDKNARKPDGKVNFLVLCQSWDGICLAVDILQG